MRLLYLCITQQHDLRLLGVAALICALGAYANVLLGRLAVATSDRRLRLRWTVAMVLASTSAIWATHFIAMLAYRVLMPSGFELKATIVSFVVAAVLLAVSMAIAVASRWRHAVVVGGAITGLAISCMHYIGMAGFRVVGTIEWDPVTVAVSIAVGIVFGILAMVASLRTRSLNALVPTLLLTIAICGDHFIAMSAATVSFDPRVDLPAGLIDVSFLGYIVAVIAVLIIGIALIAQSMHRKSRNRDESERLQMQQLADVAVEGLMICEGSRIVWINRSLEDMLPGTRADHVGRSLDDLLKSPLLDQLTNECEIDADLRVGLHTGEPLAPVRVITRAILLQGRPHLVVAVRDQRDRLRAEAEMRKLANTDSLTGLANRARFNAALEQMFVAPMPRGGNFALLSVDLDRFKSVNDSYGHGAGDAVLREVAVRLSALVRDGDLVARLGGDEFSILASRGDDPDEMRVLAERLIEAISQPFVIEGRAHQIGASVGVAFATSDGTDAETLTRNADLALYRAKEDGRGLCRMFEEDMNTRTQVRNELEQALRKAITRGEFRLHYQPQVDARSGAFTGAEALIRWEHPTRGLVPPLEFIGLAEEINVISAIGRWVLESACREAATWPSYLTVAVNLSPVQFRDPDLAIIVANALASSGLAGHRLELEITESVLIEDEHRVRATLESMRALGTRISLDDFGTGYSSLGHLRRFPVDRIKIDRSFTSRATEDRDSAAIIRAVVSLGTSLGLQTTAEGVENEAQRRFVTEEGCDQIQGYLFSRPVPSAQLPDAYRSSLGPQSVVRMVVEGEGYFTDIGSLVEATP